MLYKNDTDGDQNILAATTSATLVLSGKAYDTDGYIASPTLNKLTTQGAGLYRVEYSIRFLNEYDNGVDEPTTSYTEEVEVQINGGAKFKSSHHWYLGLSSTYTTRTVQGHSPVVQIAAATDITITILKSNAVACTIDADTVDTVDADDMFDVPTWVRLVRVGDTLV